MVDFLGRDRRSNLARPSRFVQGIKSPRRPKFSLKMYPIKRSRCSIARRNPTTPKHQDVKYGVEVGWTRRIHFIAPRVFLGGHGRKNAVYKFMMKKWVLTLLYLLAAWGRSQWIAEPHYQTSLPRLRRVDPQVMSQASAIHHFHKKTAVTMIVQNRVTKKWK
jgi:hypothetical protein